MKGFNIYFVCDAGMGSSALGAALLRRMMSEDIQVRNASVYNIPSDCDIVIVQSTLRTQIKDTAQYKKIFTIDYFLDEKRLHDIAKEIMRMIDNNKILSKDAIILGCKSVTSDEAIVAVGKLLEKKGYVEAPYIEGMLNRDHDLTTYIGNDLAIPHGEYEVKDYVLNTGIAVMIYPDGINWNGNKVRIVIGIAAKGDDHVEILMNIALKLSDMSVVDQFVDCNDVQFIYDILTKTE